MEAGRFRMHGKTKRPRGGRPRPPVRGRLHGPLQRAFARLTLVAFVTTTAAPAAADPTQTVLGPADTTAGNGEFTVNTETHTEYTQYSDRAIVDWGVDIQQGADHTLGFRQQEGFAVLNRSPGVHASNFYGTLTCDATCIFTNEAGVYFHDGSHVDVGQLIVAAGRITNDDFLAGHYVFGDLMGSVVNNGYMRGGDITLLGQRVANFGHIETPDGSFAMLAGSRIFLRDHDSPIVIESSIVPPDNGVSTASPFGDTPFVENAGLIDAGDGSVRLAAGDLLSFAIRQSGEIRARNIALEGGDDGLVEVSGILDASDATPGEVGGQIDVLGDYVSIQDGAIIDASGSAGGGRVRVGGDRLGQGDVRNARGTYLHPDAIVRADAIDAGRGGEVILFAEDTAEIYGHISAQGGHAGGDGGFVETSGKRFIDVRRAPEVATRSGSPDDLGGEWLIDPNNIEIVALPAICGSAPECLDNGLSDENVQDPQFAATGPILRPTVDDSKITADLIATVLENGSSVSIFTQTIDEVQGTQVGNITVNADIILNEDESPGPGTDVTLSLFAAQNLVINNEITVTRRGQAVGPSDLQLDLVLFAGDNAQFQAAAPADQTPNSFLGEIDLRANLDTAGGSITLQGLGVKTASGTSIQTNGGAVQLASAAGDVLLLGSVDTSTSVTNEFTGELLTGGGIEINNQVIRVPDTGEADAPTTVKGGRVVIGGDITTGGGAFEVTSLGGVSKSVGVDVRSTISTGGGAMTLRALEQTLAPASSTDVSVTGGGQITINSLAATPARLMSGGGDIDIGVADPQTLLPGARVVDIQGDIDTRVYDDQGMPDDTARGGFLFLNTVGSGARVTLGGAPGAMPSIVTNGGRIESFGDGDFEMVDASIDVRAPLVVEPVGGPAIDSNVFLQHDGDVTIDSSGQDSTISADESVTILAGGSGVGDLTFKDGGGFNATITGNRITLAAGDGASGSDSTLAQVVLANTQFMFPGGTDAMNNALETSFTLQQDADLSTSAVATNLTPAQLDTLTTVGLASSDGTITLTEATLFQGDGLGLELAAAKGVVVASGVTNPPSSPPPLESLDISIDQAFTLENSLAQFISGASKNLSIAAGTPSDPSDPSLLIDGASTAGTPMNLLASESLTLQGGRQGSGDLAFEGYTLLSAPEITLRAGNGDTVGTSQVQSDGLPKLTFDSDGAGGKLTAFTLRQDAPIDDSVIPDPSAFAVDLVGVDYTLRTDAAGSAITLDTPGAAALRDTDLRLFANGAIDLTALADQELVIDSLQIGGISSFAYTADHNDKFRFSDASTSRELVIRAGLGGTGLLSFASGLVITADKIRLVAGDGVGGGGSGGLPGSSISLQPFDGGPAPLFRKDANTGPDEFVFRQDLAITETDLPTLDVHFGGNAPDKLAIRSDDQDITFSNFSGLPLLDAKSQIVLSAPGTPSTSTTPPVPGIAFIRTDGEDLDVDALFGDGQGGTPADIQLRTDALLLSATNDNAVAGKTPLVLPGTTARVMAFDAPDLGTPFESPPAPFDFAEMNLEAPALIQVLQDGSIDWTNLIRLDRLGSADQSPVPLNGYDVVTNFGSITIRPEDVTQVCVPGPCANQANLFLNLAGLDEGDGSRTVRFDDPDDPGEIGFVVESLTVVSPFALQIGNSAPGTSTLDITAKDFMNLLAGVSNTGDLTFGTGVTLRARAIVMQAGDDPADSVRDPEPLPPDETALPVIDTSGITRLVFNDQSTTNDGTILRFFQHGKFVDMPVPPMTTGESQIIDATKIYFDVNGVETPADTMPGDPLLLDEMQLSSFSSDIDITSWGNGVGLFPTTSLRLVAGSGGLSGGTVSIGQTAADTSLNLSVDGSGNDTFDEFAIFADAMVFSSTGAGVIRARGPNLLLLGSVFGIDSTGSPLFTSPNAVHFKQESADFFEAGIIADPDCAGGCLPDSFQLGPTLAAGVDYTIESTTGQIRVNEPLTSKVWGSDLTLLANDPAEDFDVVFEVASNRDLDLFLNSLVVGASGTTDTRILLKADAADLFDDLTLVTGLSQSYNGRVWLDNPTDGDIELVGDIVEFADRIDKDDVSAAASGSGTLIVGVVTEARFNGDVGTSTNTGADSGELDRLRLNFDPSAVATSTARFGTAAGGSPTTVKARTIEFVAVSDASADTQVPRAPITSTIYKKNGDLNFIADVFTMGIGEKLTVQGNLDIGVLSTATLSDLSALTVRVGSQGGPAPTIFIQRRAPGFYLTQNGSTQPDGGIDFVANTIAFDGNIVLTGFGQNPIYGLADPRTAPAFMDGFSVFAVQQNGLPLTVGAFDWAVSSVLPDLHPEGASRDDPSTMFFKNDLVPIPPAWEAEAWLPWQRSQLSDLFVFARSMNRREYASWLADAAIIDDVGRDLQAWDGRPLPVAAQRLDGEGAKRAVVLFEEIFGADGGNVEHLRRVLQRAVDQYQRNTGARRVVGFELRRYVKNRPSSLYQAYQLLEDLDTLFAQHRGLGLTPGEYRPIQGRWLAAIQPEGITTQELAEAVQPSRYVRGSDVLDIFGD